MIKSPQNTCMSCFTQHEAFINPCPVCGYNEAAQELQPQHLRPRTILNGKYLLGKVLGQGGFGITYIGWDLNLDIKVAVKEYYPTGFVTRETTSVGSATVQAFTGSQGEFFLQGRDKFINEAKTLAKFFSLPGIVSIKDYFQENGTAYISMEYIEGQTLKDYLAKMGGKLPAGQIFDMMKPVMSSLAEVHKTGLIHRDISPDNIMISNEGNMKLLDFGAARDFTESGNKSMSIMLKPGFAPEEQYRSRGVQGPWTDVYALSATIYKCITGVTPDESVERVQADEVKPPSMLGIAVDLAREAVMMRGMAVLQENRFQSVSEMYSALYGAQTGVPVHTPVTEIPQYQAPISNDASAPKPAKPKRMTKQRWVMAIACGVAVGILTFGWNQWQRSANRPETPDRPTFSPPPIELPTSSNDVPAFAMSGYTKGTVTATGFSSEFLDLSFTAPNGYVMATSDELDAMIQFAGDTVFADMDQKVLDYAMAETVFEMMVRAVGGYPNIVIAVEKLSLSNMTEEQFLEAMKPQLTGLGYVFSTETASISIAGQDYTSVVGTNGELYQFIYVRKIEDRMVSIVLSYNDSDLSGEAINLLKTFQPFSVTETSIVGTWFTRVDDAIFEYAFNDSGEYYLMLHLSDEAYQATEGTYTITGNLVTVTPEWRVFFANNEYFYRTIFEAEDTERFNFSVSGNTLILGEDSLMKTEQSEVWGFGRRDSHQTTDPATPSPSPETPSPSPNTPSPSPATPSPSPSTPSPTPATPSPSPSPTPSPSPSPSPTPATPAVAPTGITVRNSSGGNVNTTFPIGETSRFSVTVLPEEANQTVTWTSSNTAVVSIDSTGLATARAAGYAFIYATTSNGIVSNSIIYTRAHNITQITRADTGAAANYHVDGDWGYQVVLREGLHKIRTDGTDYQKVGEITGSIIMVKNGWVYSYRGRGFGPNDDMTRVYRMRTDGTGTEEIESRK